MLVLARSLSSVEWYSRKALGIPKVTGTSQDPQSVKQ